MRNHIQTFEVRVSVKAKGSRHFSSHMGMYIEKSLTKMYHIDARTPKQAKQKAKKYGRPISTRKPDVERMRGNIESVFLRLQPVNPYPDAVAMDEMIWRRKNKRDERIQNRQKDKNGY